MDNAPKPHPPQRIFVSACLRGKDSPFCMSELHAQIQQLEEEILAAWLRQSGPELGRLFHPEFREITPDGEELTRAQILGSLRAPIVRKWQLESFAVIAVSTDHALATYVVRSESGSRTWRTSLWCRDDESWRLRFHQATRTRPHLPAETGSLHPA